MTRWIVFLTLFSLLPWLAGQGRGHGGGVGQGHGRGVSGAPPIGGKPDSRAGGERTTKPTGSAVAGMGQQTKVADQLARRPELSSRLQSLLPPGTNLPAAGKGFKNLGQFVAAAHVSRNLNIPFDQLKTQVAERGSLGKAIQTLRPDIGPEAAKIEARSAEKQAKEEIETSDAEGKAPKPRSSNGR